MKIELLCDAKAMLGEGPFWHPVEKRLYWLDIEGLLLHRFCPKQGWDETFTLPSKVGCVVPVEQEPGERTRLLIAEQKGIFEIEIASPTDRPPESEPRTILSKRFLLHPDLLRTGNRYNDGKCSPEGRFWFGSLSMIKKKDNASLFVLERAIKEGQETHSAKKVIFPATNSNGLGWSLEGETFYWTDTPTLTVRAFDYDRASGTLSHSRTAVAFPTELGFGRPDGLTVDAAGMLWIAHWAGGAISRWDPRSGAMLEKHSLPVQRVTSLTFGGEELRELYITTARQGQTVEEAAAESHAGGIFLARPEVPGTPAHFFRSV